MSSPRMLVKWLLAAALGLVVVSAGLQVVESVSSSSEWLTVLAEWANVNLDSSIPTWFSAVTLLLGAVLVFQVLRFEHARSHHDKDWTAHLWVLGVGLIYISVDEVARIHEQLNGPLRELLELGDGLRFAWVVVGFPLAVLVAMAYFRWIRSLPSDVSRLVWVGGSLFVFGAIVLELVGLQAETRGVPQGLGLVGHIEEASEMVGVILFIEAMLRYLAELGWDSRIHLPGTLSQAE